MPPFSDPAGLRRRLEEALDHHRAGRLDRALSGYREILDRAPDHPDALHYCGLILLGRGDHAGAAKLMGRAVPSLGANADFNANHGVALRAVGKNEQAKASFRRALAANPGHGFALYNLGSLLAGERDWAGAAARFGRLFEKNPDSAEIAHLLGQALAGLGRTEEAAERYRKAISLDARAMDARLDLAELELAQGRPEAAESVLAAAAAGTANLKASILMAEIRARRGDGPGRAKWLDRAREIEPQAAEVFFQAGREMQETGMAAAAERLYRHCLMIEPGHAGALWALKRLLPTVYDTEAEIEAARRRYEAGLGELEAVTRAAEGDAAAMSAAFMGMAASTNFYLAYQEGNDRDLQVRFGRVAARVMAAQFPEFAGARPMPAPEPDGRIRVGILSAFLRQHTVSRLYAGWIEKLDRRRFKVFGYHTGGFVDRTSELIARQCDAFHFVGRDILARTDRPHDRRIAEVCRAVAADRPHVLLFPEIGMDPTTLFLAALKLAPVQAAGIGHPTTTGLPTMDYFLSGALIEPEGAEAHYSETLVRLPNISVRLFDFGVAPGRKRRSRADFGFAEGEIVYVSPQSLMKYRPRYDRIFPAVAKAVPEARFAFVRPGRMAEEGIFLSRLSRAFESAGLERDRFCRFFDTLPPGEFGDLNAAADVYLDTPGWSGGNTTHEAIAAGLPIVTLPGEFMRGRVSAGMLRMIGVEDTVARDVDDYIAIAARLGRDEDYRRAVRARVEANRTKLYNDDACVRGLEEFLMDAVARARAEG